MTMSLLVASFNLIQVFPYFYGSINNGQRFDFFIIIELSIENSSFGNLYLLTYSPIVTKSDKVFYKLKSGENKIFYSLSKFFQATIQSSL